MAAPRSPADAGNALRIVEAAGARYQDMVYDADGNAVIAYSDDPDGDGIANFVDSDNDGDGILDRDDKCPTEPGEPNTEEPEKHGCPPPPDRDGDGISGRPNRVWSLEHDQWMLGRCFSTPKSRDSPRSGLSSPTTPGGRRLSRP